LGAAEKLMLLVLRGRSESRSCPPSRGSSVGSGDRLPTAKQMAAMAGAISGAKVSSGQCFRGFAARTWRENDHGRRRGERCAAGWRGVAGGGEMAGRDRRRGAERAHLAMMLGGRGLLGGRSWWAGRGTKLAHWRELQRRGAAWGFTEMAAGGDLRESWRAGAEWPGHSLGTKAEAAFGGRGRRFRRKLAGGGRRGGTKLPGRRSFQKTTTAGGAS
jgi:hypothetical protein